MILANAIHENRITLADRGKWKVHLEKDFSAAETQLANQRTALNTDSETRDLGNAKAAYDTEATRRSALIAFISEKQASGMSYDAPAPGQA